MVANPVERVLVAPRQHGRGVGDGGAVLVEHAITQFLGALDVALFLRKPHFKRADPPKRGRKLRETDRLYDG